MTAASIKSLLLMILAKLSYLAGLTPTPIDDKVAATLTAVVENPLFEAEMDLLLHAQSGAATGMPTGRRRLFGPGGLFGGGGTVPAPVVTDPSVPVDPSAPAPTAPAPAVFDGHRIRNLLSLLAKWGPSLLSLAVSSGAIKLPAGLDINMILDVLKTLGLGGARVDTSAFDVDVEVDMNHLRDLHLALAEIRTELALAA